MQTITLDHGWQTPPELQGQHASVGYATGWDRHDEIRPLMRVRDAAGDVRYYVAAQDDIDGPWEPWQSVPDIDDGAWTECHVKES